jgi:hypothetical protein
VLQKTVFFFGLYQHQLESTLQFTSGMRRQDSGSPQIGGSQDFPGAEDGWPGAFSTYICDVIPGEQDLGDGLPQLGEEAIP